MPTPQAKDPGIHHYLGLDGYRLQLGLRSMGWDANRTVLPGNYLGNEVMQDLHGAYDYKIPLAGDKSEAIILALEALYRAGTTPVLLTSVGKSAGDYAIIGRGKINGLPNSRTFNQVATWDTIWGAGDGEHVALNITGCLANHWAPGASALTATGNTAAIQMVRAVTADEEIIFVVQEADYPGPSAGSTLVGKLQSATDQAFTTPVDRITLSSIGATRGAESGVLAGAFSANLWWRIAWTVTGSTPTRYPIGAFGWRPSSTYVA